MVSRRTVCRKEYFCDMVGCPASVKNQIIANSKNRGNNGTHRCQRNICKCYLFQNFVVFPESQQDKK